MNIGRRLQQLRKAHGLSQRELAARAGLTNGTISLIEQNKTSPSVASLKSLLDAIPMSIAEFFANIEEETQPTYFYKADEFVELAPQSGGPTVSLRQLGNASNHALQVLDETYPPQADTGPELLTHAGEEAGIVIAGEIEITVADQSRVLRSGEGYLFDSRLPHRFRNISDAPCKIISACTPPTF
ncbi:cupin domain-containing protein [Sulfitobacter sp. M57]|uniref:cupin domain-containing protein n=1 Tax=unclassified Sulfitobacter TaxID=196795 RepID=UPI0023E2C1D6|nr:MULTISPECIES: cupin domain-containing protein [unclassified Sulfitobacter]MDF3413111.1 cupin domain-containing protein [Sulfitobacter sp. KE5]MDF3421606.1 cupin domain-containing protein [Sulfitobacter sp. KE43]MDF3431660.1 cupin domain-containing protein [Sulfitobacter sp. KE42]MDF3457301.1 cupin domain-containing protein [Sulfitobacter sp. S74]MDF3461203.1 cupin domain-containing protein [Sulfitobacter sp. Ks18]